MTPTDTSRNATSPITLPRRGPSGESIRRDGWIDLLAPPIDTARQVPDAIEPLRHELFSRGLTPDPVVTIENDILVAGELRRRRGDSSERYEARPVYARDAPF